MDESILVDSCRKGQLEIVTKYLNQGYDVNRIFLEDQSLLQIASCYGHADVVDLLLHYEADAQWRNRFGWTALMQAARSGHSQVVAKLLPSQNESYSNCLGSVNKLENGIDLLSLAVASNSKDTIGILVEFYKFQNKYYDKISESLALIYASLFNSRQILKFILRNKIIDINYIDPITGFTALMTATCRNNLRIAKILVKHGADVNLLNNLNQNALDIATKSNNFELKKFLKPYTEKFSSPLFQSNFTKRSIDQHFSSPLCQTCSKNSPHISQYLTPKTSHVYPPSHDLLNSPYLIIKNPAYRRNLNSSFLENSTEFVNSFSPYDQIFHSPRTNFSALAAEEFPGKLNSPSSCQVQRGEKNNWKIRCKTVINRFQNLFFKKGINDEPSYKKNDDYLIHNNNHFINVIKSLKLDKYLTIFLDHEIDYEVFITLTKENLEEIGIIKPRDQILILNKIKLIKGKLFS